MRVDANFCAKNWVEHRYVTGLDVMIQIVHQQLFVTTMVRLCNLSVKPVKDSAELSMKAIVRTVEIVIHIPPTARDCGMRDAPRWTGVLAALFNLQVDAAVCVVVC